MKISELVIDKGLVKAFVNDNKKTVLSKEDFETLIVSASTIVPGFDEVLLRRLLEFEITYPALVRAEYRSDMTRGDGSKRYRGVTQASMNFWLDSVNDDFPAYPNPETSPLSMQLLAPILYVNRYKRQVVTTKTDRIRYSIGDLPLIADVVYGIHQQGPSGFIEFAFGGKRLIGNQSGSSSNALKQLREVL